MGCPKDTAERPSNQIESETALLERPGRLKAWANELCAIVQDEADPERLFKHWGRWESKLTRSDLSESLEKIGNCGSVLELRRGLNRETGELTPFSLHAGNFCRQPAICPLCAGRLQDTRKKAWKAPILAAAQEFEFAYLVTATVRPRDDWRASLAHLRESLARMRRKGQKGRRGEWAKVCAALGKIEFKRGKGGAPHVHWHGLVFTRRRLDYRIFDRTKNGRVPIRPYWDAAAGKEIALSKLTAEWLDASGDSYNFDCKPLEVRPKDLAKGMSRAESIFEQSREVLKYVTKFDSRPEAGQEALFVEDFVGIRDASYNRRLFSSYGAFYGLKKDEYADNRISAWSRPLFFRAGYQPWARAYGEPQEVRGPVFPDYESQGMRRLLLEENRMQGNFRRARSALWRHRDAVRAGSPLSPVELEWKRYEEDGSISILSQILEPPADLVRAPKSLEAWERWAGELKEAGREARKAIRDEARRRFEEVPDTWKMLVEKDRARRWFAERAQWFQDSVLKAFREVLDAPGRMVPAPAPS